MTDEQIIQKAEEYVSNLFLSEQEEENYKFTFIDGAYSRDEEIEEMKKQLAAMTRLKNSFAGGVDILDNDNKELQEELDKLRNPWISVDERLPENNCVVFVSLDGTEYLSAHYRVASKRFITVSKDKQALVEVRKSSATYTVCGDCIKEEHFYSEGQREDITSLVTHWMPIPQIKKGGEK